jgi:DNA-binding NtrC family response regulator
MGKNILVADDEEPIRKLLSEFLGSMLGYSVKTVDNVIDAIDQIKDDESLDLVISDFDFKMPSLTGKDVYEYVQQNKPNLPFILFSACTPSKYGFSKDVDYITKPADLNEIRERVERYTGKP